MAYLTTECILNETVEMRVKFRHLALIRGVQQKYYINCVGI